MTQATEPTDIVWENTHYRKGMRRFRILVVLVVMGLLAFGVFMLVIWLLKRKLLIEYMRNPPGIQCDSFGPASMENVQLAYKEEREWRKIDIYSYDLNSVTSR